MEYIFDTHAHYDDEDFDADRYELLDSMKEHGVGTIVNIGASMRSCKTTLALAEKYPFVYGALGVHPSDCGKMTEEDIQWIKANAANEKIVAIGEIGLDYYWDNVERDVQKKWFVRQLEIAKEIGLPVIIHSRDAAQDTLEIMKSEHKDTTGGVIHCFSYGVEMAREYLNMDYYIGVGGVLTFKNGKKLKEVVEYAPMDKLVLETDCPYLAPVPYRGKRNSSLYLTHVVEEMAAIKGMSVEDVIRVTAENAKRLYRLV
ncbi:MAG: TatD family hydrolase [Lachnospiraceae bacterium]|nr:TatD family hydrolase [Lachnospiraceae bacterium]